MKKKLKANPHNRELFTKYVGKIIQHDFSHHLFSLPAKETWPHHKLFWKQGPQFQ